MDMNFKSWIGVSSNDANAEILGNFNNLHDALSAEFVGGYTVAREMSEAGQLMFYTEIDMANGKFAVVTSESVPGSGNSIEIASVLHVTENVDREWVNVAVPQIADRYVYLIYVTEDNLATWNYSYSGEVGDLEETFNFDIPDSDNGFFAFSPVDNTHLSAGDESAVVLTYIASENSQFDGNEYLIADYVELTTVELSSDSAQATVRLTAREAVIEGEDYPPYEPGSDVEVTYSRINIASMVDSSSIGSGDPFPYLYVDVNESGDLITDETEIWNHFFAISGIPSHTDDEAVTWSCDIDEFDTELNLYPITLSVTNSLLFDGSININVPVRQHPVELQGIEQTVQNTELDGPAFNQPDMTE